MIWVLIILFAILTYVGWYIMEEYDNFLGVIVGGVSIVVELFLVIMLGALIFTYPFKAREKISMYEEENAKIEEKVKNTVKVYMDYEKETYTNLVEESDLTTLLVAYPELNSNELVKSEIKLYMDNNQKIKELKEAEIERTTYRFMLYFGR
jgi:hypothetical protein